MLAGLQQIGGVLHVSKGVMSKAKWFVVWELSAGEIITNILAHNCTSANQIVPLKFRGGAKMLYYIHQTSLII